MGVARMQELKIKEDPTLADGDKKKDEKKDKKKPASEEKAALQAKMEEYRLQLKQEFGYSDKDIKADPDYADMQKQLSKLKWAFAIVLVAQMQILMRSF